ncbi:DinB family protein [Bacillus sp. sid0103]|uniref:DinB family protein n=1 Tax=Bacillus sp. sid0103 TaxID=2856337 RepID=UPI001C4448DE|nr:DinB family protein [Bacillus sp. sid0103]MBV7504734.1 DinB family protein [Bacillus sp. sid0103]
MSRKDVILEQFLFTHNRNGWFVSFQSAVEGLTPEQAKWKKSESDNSIWELVNHLVFWNEYCLNKFKGIPGPKLEGSNHTTFYNRGELGWQQTVDRFNSVMSIWYETIETCDDDKLDQFFNPESKSSWITTLSSLALHNAYHIGQIVTIRKMQGSWDKAQGVN